MKLFVNLNSDDEQINVTQKSVIISNTVMNDILKFMYI